FELEESATRITLTTAALELAIDKADFGLAARRRDGSLLFESTRDANGRAESIVRLNDEFVVSRRAAPSDSFFGLGEKTGASERGGRSFTLWNVDVLSPGVLARNRLYEVDTTLPGRSTRFEPYYSSIPFFYHARENGDGLALCGFFVDNGYPARFEFE